MDSGLNDVDDFFPITPLPQEGVVGCNHARSRSPSVGVPRGMRHPYRERPATTRRCREVLLTWEVISGSKIGRIFYYLLFAEAGYRLLRVNPPAIEVDHSGLERRTNTLNNVPRGSEK